MEHVHQQCNQPVRGHDWLEVKHGRDTDCQSMLEMNDHNNDMPHQAISHMLMALDIIPKHVVRARYDKHR